MPSSFSPSTFRVCTTVSSNADPFSSSTTNHVRREEAGATVRCDLRAVQLVDLVLVALDEGTKEILDDLGKLLGVHGSISVSSETNMACSRWIRAHSSITTGW